YPDGVLSTATDDHSSFEVSSAALAATRGVTLIAPNAAPIAVDTFGEVPRDLDTPAEVTWRAGVRLPNAGVNRFTVSDPGRAELRIDDIAVAGRASEGTEPLVAEVLVAPGLHFVELTTLIASPQQRARLTLAEPEVAERELQPTDTYRLMDAPWGLLSRLERRQTTGEQPLAPADALLDSTIAMAFFPPEFGFVQTPNTLTWTGTLVAPRTGIYRMAFAAEDEMRLELDGERVEVQVARPDAWPPSGVGSQVRLAEGPHRVRVTLLVTHGGRDL